MFTSNAHLVLAAASAGLLALIGCVGDRKHAGVATAEGTPLTETYWKVIAIQDKAVIVASNFREPHLILRSKDNRVNAHGGINNMGGTYKVTGERLTFSPLFGTKMAGPKLLNEQENAFASALSNANGYSISGDILTLKQDGVATIVFKAVTPK